MAQTENSAVDGVLVGNMANVALRSFAFDKPFSCFKGGSLELVGVDAEFEIHLLEKYKRLSLESVQKTKRDLREFWFLFYYSDKHEFSDAFDNQPFFGFLLALGFSFNVTAFLIKLSYLNFIFRKIFAVVRLVSKKKPYKVFQLPNEKIEYILRQRSNFFYDEKEVNALETFLESHSFTIKTYPGSEVLWNRYSLFDVTGKLTKLLNAKGVQANNHNWPRPLHLRFHDTCSVKLNGELKNSEHASRHVVNIPIWSNFFQQEVNVVQKKPL